jgi:nicotinamidase-related amidase
MKIAVTVLFTVVLGLSTTAGQQRPAPTGPPTVTVFGREIPNTEEEILNPKHTVLVVHEMENDFISVGGARPGGRIDADAIIPTIAKLLSAARAKNVRVAHVRWTRHADGSTDTDSQRRNNLGRPGPLVNIEGTWGWDHPDPIKPAPGEWVIPKWRTNAFFSTPLDALMRWNGIKTMVIVGIGAEAGIVPSVNLSSSMGYFTVAVEDAIRPSNPTRMEDAMRFIRGPAIVKQHTEVIDIWNKHAAAPGLPVAGQASPASAATVSFRGRQIPNTLDEILNPKHTVLLVHEMLNDFISKGGALDKAGRRIDADAILSPMAKLIAAARAKRVRVAYVRWTNYADYSAYSDPTIQSGWSRWSSGQMTPPFTVEGTWGWEINDTVKPAPGDWVLRKYRPDAFFATPLDTLMRWNGVKTLVIVGIGAEVGVVPTLMTASNLGYFRVAASDLLRPTNPARMDDAMRYVNDYATVKTSAELAEIWGRAEATPLPAPKTAP